jgi:hypothetical protein
VQPGTPFFIAMPQPISLSQRSGIVRRQFYRQYDDIPRGIEYIVAAIYGNYLVAEALHENRQGYRFMYELDESSHEVTFTESGMVHWEWVEGARQLEIDEKAVIIRSLEDQPSSGDAPEEGRSDEPVNDYSHLPTEVSRSFGTARMSSDGSRTTFQIMTGIPARDGLILDPSGLDTSAYLLNPVVLWQHGNSPERGYRPIGRCVNLVRNGAGYLGEMEWNTDEFSQGIREDVKNGFLNMASIRWRSLERRPTQYEGRTYPTDVRSEMLEFSVVGVGANAHALVTSRATEEIDGLRSMVESLAQSVGTLANTVANQSTVTANPAPARSEEEVTAPISAPAVPVSNEPVTIPAEPEHYRSLAATLAPMVEAIVSEQIDRVTGRA